MNRQKMLIGGQCFSMRCRRPRSMKWPAPRSRRCTATASRRSQTDLAHQLSARNTACRRNTSSERRRAAAVFLAEAASRVMAETEDTDRTSAAALIPDKPRLDELREAAAECTACPLFRYATQIVFGEGPERAAILFVGEQPGDSEDLAGRPFVGSAGKLLDRCLKAAG